jgi:hypothetical protein
MANALLARHCASKQRMLKSECRNQSSPTYPPHKSE